MANDETMSWLDSVRQALENSGTSKIIVQSPIFRVGDIVCMLDRETDVRGVPYLVCAVGYGPFPYFLSLRIDLPPAEALRANYAGTASAEQLALDRFNNPDWINDGWYTTGAGEKR